MTHLSMVAAIFRNRDCVGATNDPRGQSYCSEVSANGRKISSGLHNAFLATQAGGESVFVLRINARRFTCKSPMSAPL